MQEGLATFLCSGGSIAATPNSTVVKADLDVKPEYYRTLSDHDAAVLLREGWSDDLFLNSGGLLLHAETLDRRSSVPPEGQLSARTQGR
jgi:hypothetical protein